MEAVEIKHIDKTTSKWIESMLSRREIGYRLPQGATSMPCGSVADF